MKAIVILISALALATPGLSAAIDTVSCEGKRGWQRQIVRDSVHAWFRGLPEPDDLVELVQAEHGIVACAGGASPPRLHTTRLQPGLELDQFGAVLLANELEWSGLMPRPEEGLAGEFFRIQPHAHPQPDDALPLDASR